MSVKYVVSCSFDKEKKETLLETKDFEKALRKFLEYAEEPYWRGDKTQVVLSFEGKGKNK